MLYLDFEHRNDFQTFQTISKNTRLTARIVYFSVRGLTSFLCSRTEKSTILCSKHPFYENGEGIRRNPERAILANFLGLPRGTKPGEATLRSTHESLDSRPRNYTRLSSQISL